MPIPPPVLDDRTYADLAAELKSRIAVYTPEWTDPSESDPGLTLLELVAFLGENLLYRFNQIPDATQAWMLRLLQVPLRPATTATGIVAFTPASPAVVTVDAGTVVRAGAVRFETEQDVTVVPVEAVAVAKVAAPAPTDEDLVAAAQAAIDAHGGIGDGTAPAYYEPTQLGPDPMATGAVPLDVPSAVDATLWVAVLAPRPDVDADIMLASDGPLDGATLNIGVALAPQLPSMFDVDPCDGVTPGIGTPPPTQIEWQVSTVEVDADGEPKYRSLPFTDTTGGLRHDGVVRLQLPALPGLIGVPEPEPDGAGVGTFPPELDDPRPVLFWLRAFPLGNSAEIPPLTWVGVNSVEVVQAVTVGPEFLGTGTGAADQQFSLAHRPVQPDAKPVELEVEEQGHWTPWTRVDSFVGLGPDDRVWVLDAEAGTARFGTTLTGRAPQARERVRVRGYRFGGGLEGNTPAKAINAVETGAAVHVANPLPTSGGAPAETIAEGLARIPGEFRRHDRAVTASDFAELAAMTPGSEVGRAECLPLFHPPDRDTQAAGVVTVVVWPRADAAHPDAPQPDRGLLNGVCAFLDRRRLVTTELYVVPPAYRTIAVSVAVVVKPGYSPDAVRRWVELVIRQYLAPLPPYGPDGRGWPLGRPVLGPELQAAALQVEGVDYLADLAVAELADDGTSWTPAETIGLEPWEVVAVGAVTVVAASGPDDAAPPFGAPPGPPDPPGPIIPVPTRREVC